MDISSLLSSSIPSYFVIGPIVLIIITLVVLAARKASPTTPVTQPASVAPAVAVPMSSIAQMTVPQVSPISNHIAEMPTQAPVPAPAPTPMAQAPVMPTPDPIVEAPVPPTPPTFNQVMEPVPAQVHVEQPLPPAPVMPPPPFVQEPVVISQAPPMEAPMMAPEPMVATAPPVENIPTVAPTPEPVSVPTGVIPPISSWKPAEPSVAPQEESHSEAQMQAEAAGAAQQGGSQ